MKTNTSTSLLRNINDLNSIVEPKNPLQSVSEVKLTFKKTVVVSDLYV